MATASEMIVTIAPSIRLVQKAEISFGLSARAVYHRMDQLSGGNDRICSPLNEIGTTRITGASRNRNRTATRTFMGTEVSLASMDMALLFDSAQHAGIGGKRRPEDDQHQHRERRRQRPVQGHDGLIVDFGGEQEDPPSA